MPHTPEPWEVFEGFEPGSLLIVRDEEPFAEIAHIPPVLKRGTMLANASLMAAAPDLLAALQELVAVPNKKRPARVWNEARAAIARAEGA